LRFWESESPDEPLLKAQQELRPPENESFFETCLMPIVFHFLKFPVNDLAFMRFYVKQGTFSVPLQDRINTRFIQKMQKYCYLYNSKTQFFNSRIFYPNSTGIPVLLDSWIAHIILVAANPSSPVAIGFLSLTTQSTKCLILSIPKPVGLP